MRVLLLSNDLMFGSKLAGAARQAMVELTTSMSAAALVDRAAQAPSELVIIDLSTPGSDPAALVPQLRSLSAPPRAIVAYGPHVQAEKLAAAQEAGCDEVFTRGQFSALAAEILTRYAAR